MERHKTKRKTRKSIIKIHSERKSIFNEGYITNYQTPEAIVKNILDKIINLSIRQSRLNKINNQYKSFCFKYIQNQIEPLFEESYINYTQSNNSTNIIFWNSKNPKKNEWIEIKEPENPIYDRFEGAFTNLKELESKNKKLQVNKIKESIENEKLINNEKDNSIISEKEKISKNKQIKKKSVFKENKNKEEENNNINNIKPKAQQNNQNIKSKKIQMVTFPAMDIPDIDKEFIHDEFDPPNIKKLRIEREEEIKRKEREKKLLIEEKKITKKKDDSEKINKKLKQLDSNKYTFDSNGTIISFKQYKLENLSKDFNFIKNSIKGGSDRIKIKKKKNITIKEQSIKIDEEVIKNPVEEEKKEKYENREKIIPSGSNFQFILPNIGVVIKENQKIKEGGREFNKFFNKYSINDYTKILNEYVPMQNRAKMKTKMDKMNLTTNNIIQKKISHSIDNPKNNKNNDSQNNYNTINKTFNYNNYNINDNINTKNPLLNTNDNIQININDIDNNMINNSYYLKTSIGINSFNKNSNNYNPLMTTFNIRSKFINYSQGKKRNNLNDSIKMKKRGGTSLKLEIESMIDLNNDKTYFGEENVKQKNIFGKNFIKNYKIGLIKPPINNSLATFNKSILTDSNWGNNSIGKGKQKENIIFAKHHTKQQALRELGKNFLNGIKIKLPRNRKVEINK